MGTDRLTTWMSMLIRENLMQARVFGGAYNFLKVNEFIEVVKSQRWREPQNVQLLIQDEEDERFTLYDLSG